MEREQRDTNRTGGCENCQRLNIDFMPHSVYTDGGARAIRDRQRPDLSFITAEKS